MSKKTEARYKSLPAGLRNNNHLNIRKSASKWRGTRLPERKHPFVEFISPEYGYRAAFIIMCKSYRKRGLISVADIITAWAPRSENNTSMYIARVMADLNLIYGWPGFKDYVTPEPNMAYADFWCRLAFAMARVEIGNDYIARVDYRDIEAGYDLYLETLR